jgi:hypothetical protein
MMVWVWMVEKERGVLATEKGALKKQNDDMERDKKNGDSNFHKLKEDYQKLSDRYRRLQASIGNAQKDRDPNRQPEQQRPPAPVAAVAGGADPQPVVTPKEDVPRLPEDFQRALGDFSQAAQCLKDAQDLQAGAHQNMIEFLQLANEAKQERGKAEEERRKTHKELADAQAAKLDAERKQLEAADKEQKAQDALRQARAAETKAAQDLQEARKSHALVAAEREAAKKANEQAQKALLAAKEQDNAAALKQRDAAAKENQANQLELKASQERQEAAAMRQEALDAKAAAQQANADSQGKLDQVNLLQAEFRPAVMKHPSMIGFAQMIEAEAATHPDAAMLLAQLYILAACEKATDADPKYRLAAIKEISRFLLRFLGAKGMPPADIMATLSSWAQQFNAAGVGIYSVQIPRIGGSVDRVYMTPARAIEKVSRLVTWAVRNDTGIAEYMAEVE